MDALRIVLNAAAAGGGALALALAAAGGLWLAGVAYARDQERRERAALEPARRRKRRRSAYAGLVARAEPARDDVPAGVGSGGARGADARPS
jgi:hypothetical protein